VTGGNEEAFAAAEASGLADEVPEAPGAALDEDAALDEALAVGAALDESAGGGVCPAGGLALHEARRPHAATEKAAASVAEGLFSGRFMDAR
jgi:hypothetical protein